MARLFLLTLVLCLTVQGVYGFLGDEVKPPKQLKWPGRTIKVFISSSMAGSSSAIKPDSDINNAVLSALQRWEEAANVEFKVAFSDTTSISPPGQTGDGISLITIAPENENMLAFSQKTQNASGLTRVFYDSRGAITEADIALNPTQLFTTDKTPGTFDLEAVLTHEVGHLLGLSHSADRSSLMFEGVTRNGASDPLAARRPLSADDRSKIRRLYGLEPADDNCCVRIKGRLDVAEGVSHDRLIWVQYARSGALVEVLSARNKAFEFGPFARGSYEVIAQSASSTNLLFGADNSGIRDVEANRNILVPVASKPAAFDLQVLGLNGELSKRAVNVQAGHTYRLVIAGPGLNLPDLQFGATSKEIALDPIRSEFWASGRSVDHRAFQITISTSAKPGQYSIFAEDRTGSRRYLVGGIAVN